MKTTKTWRMVLTGCVVWMLAPMAAMAQKWEGLADTPQMGWSTWNKFQERISEEVIKGIADAMVETGLRDAGYKVTSGPRTTGDGYYESCILGPEGIQIEVTI